LFVSNSQVIGCEDRLRNDLTVSGGVLNYSIQSITSSSALLPRPRAFCLEESALCTSLEIPRC